MGKTKGRVLHLMLKRRWFELIVSGRKTLEYRERKPHWESRLLDENGQVRRFDIIQFRNGYHRNAPIARTGSLLRLVQRLAVEAGKIRVSNTVLYTHVFAPLHGQGGYYDAGNVGSRGDSDLRSLFRKSDGLELAGLLVKV